MAHLERSAKRRALRRRVGRGIFSSALAFGLAEAPKPVAAEPSQDPVVQRGEITGTLPDGSAVEQKFILVDPRSDNQPPRVIFTPEKIVK